MNGPGYEFSFISFHDAQGCGIWDPDIKPGDLVQIRSREPLNKETYGTGILVKWDNGQNGLRERISACTLVGGKLVWWDHYWRLQRVGEVDSSGAYLSPRNT